jgi:hypothetical protein
LWPGLARLLSGCASLILWEAGVNRAVVWSFGGGVQSVALLVLIAEGKLPKPERVVMSDTGRESSLTWDYTRKYTVPLLESLGMRLEIAGHELSTVDLYTHKGALLIPAFTKTGMFPTYCSSHWKKLVCRRYLRAVGYGPAKPVSMWFGMSLDEFARMRESDVDWIENYYPLCFDVKLRRHECVLAIEQFGLPVPPKSSCWMCPNRSNAEWLQQQREAPGDHSQAVELDAAIRAADPMKGLYLHVSRQPLDAVDFGAADKSSGPGDACANFCWT